MTYEKATAEVLVFDNSDVITKSNHNCKYNGGCGGNGGGNNPGGGGNKPNQCHNKPEGEMVPQSYIDGLSAGWLD